ncbi:MAG TPA: energy transducer TonB [Bacteroidales bacterium]|nr:energy transducer TonB [Bacteroidales bacterium]
MLPLENVIIANSFEEIVFTNRNKEYGAYLLRKKQKGYVIIAFTVAFLFVSSLVITPLIYNHYRGNSPRPELGPIIVGEIDTTLMVTPPVLPDVKYETPNDRYVPPLVVDSVDENNTLLAMGDLVDNNSNIAPPATFEVPTQHQPDVIEEPEKPFIKVEISAEFEGGDLMNFNRWVAKNIVYPQIAVENGITGKVYVQFVVNASGKVENVIVLRGADPSLDQEAVRVIQSSPKWSAPLQGGRAVKQLFTLPVVFKLDQH